MSCETQIPPEYLWGGGISGGTLRLVILYKGKNIDVVHI